MLATGFESLVQTHARYGRRLTPADEREAYAEYRTMWLLVGLGDDDVPVTVEEFHARYEAMIDADLEHTASVDHVFETLRGTPAPPALEHRAGRLLWSALKRPIGALTIHQAVWQLRPAIRERLGLRWTARDERIARVAARGLRVGFALLPRPLRLLPPAFAGNRREGTLLRSRPGRPRSTAA